MWLITGPFDGETQGDLNIKRTKLLKTSSRYTLGRKDRQLVVNNKKISHNHGEFIVGAYTVQDMAHPDVIPRLELFNAKNKAMSISRGSEDFIINPSSIHELQDGDKVHIVVGIPLEVHWRRISCYAPSVSDQSSINMDLCASLGISIVNSPHPLITHHLTSAYEISAPVACSLLLAAHFVKLDWLLEYLRMGDKAREGVLLEQMHNPPPESKYRPTFSPSLVLSLKTFKIWEPNEERINMLRGYRFILLGEQGKEISAEVRSVVTLGGGEYECCSSGITNRRWRQILAKGKQRVEDLGASGKGLFIVTNEMLLKTGAEADRWNEFILEAQSLGIRLVTPHDILTGVVNIDLSRINQSILLLENLPARKGNHTPSTFPDFVPNTYSDEPSVPPEVDEQPGSAVSRTFAEESTSAVKLQSQLPAGEKPVDSIKEPEAIPLSILLRRARIARQKVDSSADDIFSSSNGVPPPDAQIQLKRRAGTAIISASLRDLIADKLDGSREPPLKKFKALFDASDPARLIETATPAAVGETVMGEIRPTDSKMPSVATIIPSPCLEIIEEEAEDSQESTLASKKTFSAHVHHNTDDVRMSTLDPPRPAQDLRGQATPEPAQFAKHMEAETGQRSLTQDRDVHAAQRKPDIDEAFLKAVASTKKGKKSEDDFDREFNKLRISKPELHSAQQEEEWAVLDDFEDAQNIRGNFVVVLDLDVFKQCGNSGSTIRYWDSDWADKPNFKKFKKRANRISRTHIVTIAQEADYGIGAGYWKTTSRARPISIDRSSQKATRTSAQTGGQKRCAPDSAGDASDGPPARKKGKQSSLTKAKAVSQHDSEIEEPIEKRGHPDPLFLESDESKQSTPALDILNFDDETIALRPATPSIGKITLNKFRRKDRKINATALEDDNSDDGGTFRGFGTRGRA